jgi:hypothetical protein
LPCLRTTGFNSDSEDDADTEYSLLSPTFDPPGSLTGGDELSCSVFRRFIRAPIFESNNVVGFRRAPNHISVGFGLWFYGRALALRWGLCSRGRRVLPLDRLSHQTAALPRIVRHAIFDLFDFACQLVVLDRLANPARIVV